MDAVPGVASGSATGGDLTELQDIAPPKPNDKPDGKKKPVEGTSDNGTDKVLEGNRNNKSKKDLMVKFKAFLDKIEASEYSNARKLDKTIKGKVDPSLRKDVAHYLVERYYTTCLSNLGQVGSLKDVYDAANSRNLGLKEPASSVWDKYVQQLKTSEKRPGQLVPTKSLYSIIDKGAFLSNGFNWETKSLKSLSNITIGTKRIKRKSVEWDGTRLTFSGDDSKMDKAFQDTQGDRMEIFKGNADVAGFTMKDIV
jgi:hypothetical protein